MGLLNDAGDLLNRGVASAGRGTKAITLKAQIAEINKRRSSIMAQLGESLYDATKDIAEYRAPREALYASVEDLDVQRGALQAELDAIERQANLVSAAPATFSCPNCGQGLAQDDVFCSGCGKKVEDLLSAMPSCPSCGKPIGGDDAFCVHCGKPMQSLVEEPMEEEGPDANEPITAVSTDDTRVCPACGYQANVDSVFCRSCGLRL